MKWYKHETRRKAALKRLIMEYGIEGYGLYHVCIELIAGDISIKNLTFELEEDAELIAHEFKMDTIKVEKIMHRCIELGLFDLADSGRLRCLALAAMLDETISKNAHVKDIKKKITGKLDKYNNSGVIPETSGDIPPRIEENRIEKNRIDNIYTFSMKRSDYGYKLIEHWNDLGLTACVDTTFFRQMDQDDWLLVEEIVQVHGEDAPLKAIDNYKEVSKGKEYYYNHVSYTLVKFLKKGLEGFIDAANPKSSYRNTSEPESRSKVQEYINSIGENNE